MKLIKLIIVIFSFPLILNAQQIIENSKGVYVDQNGVMRWIESKQEVSLFGVNYTTPFAYSFRAHQKLGLSLRQAIDLDVEQMVRLGFDAFRVHVWDREISDKDGNLLQNEHLKLLDYLLTRLAENNIKTIITPIAWWGNGWPEPDEQTPGFSSYYKKVEMVTDSNARTAQRNYLKQFIEHKNKFNGIDYKNDPSIIAVEIINEPHHPDDATVVTGYINEMVQVLRDAGLAKPIFYNISENWSDTQANAVTAANIDGVSFQWYPTDLVHNRMLKGNYLINVNKYLIPSENVACLDSKAKMVYEFDAADIGGSYMYPAMARSYREAGMQFATMFSYDPVQIAWSNTEYPTHFLNLFYTPSKAISLMIAAKAFHDLPRMKSYGNYPNNNRFENFSVNHETDLSELNSTTHFYYSNSTGSTPKNISSLEHIAGVGNSSLINYDGTGSYFLDKLEEGIWRLEVYPDALWIRDPFKQTSMSRQVSKLFWNEREMSISLPDLNDNFGISSLMENKVINFSATQSKFMIQPGIYLLYSKTISADDLEKHLSKRQKWAEGLYLPDVEDSKAFVINKTGECLPRKAKPDFKFQIASDKKIEDMKFFIRHTGWRRFEKYSLIKKNGFDFTVADSIKYWDAGIQEYCVAVKVENEWFTYPGEMKGSPDDWDFYPENTWQVKVLEENDALVLFDAGSDFHDISYPQFSRSLSYRVDLGIGDNSENEILNLNIKVGEKNPNPFGFQTDVSEILKPFRNAQYHSVEIRCGSSTQSKINLSLILNDGGCFTYTLNLEREVKEFKIPFSEFKSGSALILPFSYPKFLPKFWNPKGLTVPNKLSGSQIQFIQVTSDSPGASGGEANISIQSIALK
ncbi:MAG: cellulase family glycosylhydrolase [bacterium]